LGGWKEVLEGIWKARISVEAFLGEKELAVLRERARFGGMTGGKFKSGKAAQGRHGTDLTLANPFPWTGYPHLCRNLVCMQPPDGS
jgi:hypothetical protein